MPKAIIIESFGGPEVLKSVNVTLDDPKPGQVQIKHTAIEVNAIDIMQRKGLYAAGKGGINVPGVAAVGVIEKLADDVDGFEEGDRVGYINRLGGAYSEKRNISAESIFMLPPELDDVTIGSCLAKAMTAHYLCNRAFVVRASMVVVIHAAASGVGKLLSQWCAGLGAYVIGTVGSDDKKQVALSNGCRKVFNYSSSDWVKEVRAITKDVGANAVYDSIGDAVFDQSLDALMNMGILISYGASSGPVKSINPEKLKAKSLFVTMPSLFHYKAGRLELVLSAEEVFKVIGEGNIIIPEPAVFKLDDVGKAHAFAEERSNTQSVVLVP